MTRYLLLIPVLVLLSGSFAPLAHAAIPVIDSSFHIVPDAHELDPTCDPGAPLSFGAIMEIIQRLANASISFGVIICVLIMTWAGLLFVMSATNPEMRSTARTMLGNAAVGLLIILSAWLIVDFVMKTLYSGDDGTKGAFGPWNSLLGDGPACIVANETNNSLFSGKITASQFAAVDYEGTGGTSGSGGGSSANCPAADPSTMVSFPSNAVQGGSQSATKTTVTNFLAMRAAALKDGVDLRVVSSYRSEAKQVSLWNQYHQDTSQVAKPCSKGGGGSNHNSGTALDLTVGCSKTDSSCSSKEYKWLKANGAKWNFRNALPGDTVHWSPSGR